MLALPPLLPTASRTYDFANEAGFRTALTRYFQQQRTDSTVVDPSGTASAIPGTLVKAIGGGVLANTQVTETVGLLTVAESLRVTGATALASTLTVGGAGSFLTTLHSAGAVTFDTTLLASGIATFGSAVWAGTDGTLGIGQRAANRFASLYATTHLWLGTTPPVTIPGGLTGTDSFTGSVSTNLSSHTPDSGFLGWNYSGAASSWILTGFSTAQCNASGAGAFVRATAALGDDNLNYRLDLAKGAVAPSAQTMGLMVWQPTSGSNYQNGEGLQLGVDRASGNFLATLRNSSGTTLDTQSFGAAPTAWTVSNGIRLGVTLAGVTATWWWQPIGGGTQTAIGTYTIPSAYQATFKDGAHKGGGWTGTSNSASGLIYVGVAVAQGTGAQVEADGFAAYMASPTAGTYAVGGGQYIGNHGAAGLTDGYGLYIEDQVGSTHNHAFHTGLGDVSLGDAVTMASTLGVTGAITGSSTIQGTTITATTRFTGPLIGTTSAVDVVFDRNSVTQLTLGSLAATFAGTVQGTQLKSTIATGTSPLTVASTTLVSNLTSQYLGASGQDATYFLDPTHLSGFGAAAGYLRSTGSAWARVSGIAAADVSAGALANGMTATTQTPGDNTTKISTTAFVTAAIAAYTAPVTSVFGRTGAVVAATNDYAFSQISGTIATGQVSGAYGGITGVGTLASGAVPASLVTAGTFGAGNYTFPANLTTGVISSSTFSGFGTSLWQVGSGDAWRLFADGLSASAQVDTYGNTAGFLSAFLLRRARGTLALPLDVAAADSIGGLRFIGFVNTAFREMARVGAVAAGTPGVGSNQGVLRFSAVPDASTTLVDLLDCTALSTTTGALYPVTARTNLVDLGISGTNIFRNIFYGGQLTSIVATGTAPFVVASTTLVANLHAASADTSTTPTAGNNSTSIATTAYVDRATGTTANSTAAPHNTTSTTGVMMGLALAYTPTIATKVLVTITGAWANATLADGVKMQIRYGTGTAPTNTAGTTALTGTAVGSLQSYNKQAVATDQTNFTLCFPITGLTIGTTYWIDMSLGCITGGTASVTTVDAVALETT